MFWNAGGITYNPDLERTGLHLCFTSMFSLCPPVCQKRIRGSSSKEFVHDPWFCRAMKTKGTVFRYTWVYSKEDTMAHTCRLVVTS